MIDKAKNFAIALVSTTYDDDDTSIVLESGGGAKFPDPATDGEYNLVWWNASDYPNPADDPNAEIVRVTALSTDTLTVTRAQEGTAASVKNVGSQYKMMLGITAKTIDDIIDMLATKISQGGDSLGTDMIIGTGDSEYLIFRTNGSNRGWIEPSGDWYIATQLGVGVDPGVATLTVGLPTNPRTAYSNSILQLLSGETGTDNLLLIDTANTNGVILFRHSGGSMGTPSATLSGNYIGNLQFYGYDGNSFDQGFHIGIFANGDWTDSNHSANLLIQGYPSGSTSITDLLRLTGNGSLQLGFNSATATPRLILDDTTKDPITDPGDINNYLMLLRRGVNTNNTGIGIAFSNTTDTSNVGAAIINRRTNSNGMGELQFYTKRVNTAGTDPVLAMTIKDDGDVHIEEDVILDGGMTAGGDIDAVGNVISNIALNPESGTTYTLALTDRSKLVDCDNASPISVTVPDNADVAFPIGSKILIRQKGAGQVTLVEDTSVQIDCALSLTTTGINSVIGIIKIDTDTWLAFGDFEPL